MGNMAAILSNLNSAESRMARKRAAVDEFVKHRRLPRCGTHSLPN